MIPVAGAPASNNETVSPTVSEKSEGEKSKPVFKVPEAPYRKNGPLPSLSVSSKPMPPNLAKIQGVPLPMSAEQKRALFVKEHEKALVALNEVLKTQPAHADTLMQKGAHLIALEQWKEALETVELANKENPNHPLLLRMIGQCYVAMENLELGEKFLKQALDLKKETALYPMYLKYYDDCLAKKEAVVKSK